MQLSLLEGKIAAPDSEFRRSPAPTPSNQIAPNRAPQADADYGLCRCGCRIAIPGLDASRCAECGWIRGGAV